MPNATPVRSFVFMGRSVAELRAGRHGDYDGGMRQVSLSSLSGFLDVPFSDGGSGRPEKKEDRFSGEADVLFDPATGRATTLLIRHKDVPGESLLELIRVRIENERFVLPDVISGEAKAAVTSTQQSLLELPVRTVSGEELGKVHDAMFFWETRVLHRIAVGGGLIASLIKEDLLIFWQDIEEIRPEEIVVSDRIVKKKAGEGIRLLRQEPGLATGTSARSVD